ncbi:guanylate kinase [Candidatus Methylopumilus turicensis]|uniref:Guanylate kinase n=1 Tax=Candidatus Methylopumilus turicensis TaxID=1581680 RepID=A0A0B7IX52_9PROT|nr:guanylate kinase [Candidatus Methylopumilus turicensis]CEN55090.1 guanylate kinase [Candidatus Methylopumilus turicensis]
MSGNLFIITAASGAGKTSLVRALLAADSQIKLSISYTTRQPRPGEVNGEHYHFVEEATFLSMLGEGDFLESAHVHGARYGTSQTRVDEALASGNDLILEIDWQGAAQVRKLYSEAISIFILPPSIPELESRLRGRGQDSEEVILKRLAAAREEMSHVGEFDYVTINDKFEKSLQDLVSIVRAQRLKCNAQLARHAALVKGLV